MKSNEYTTTIITFSVMIAENWKKLNKLYFKTFSIVHKLMIKSIVMNCKSLILFFLVFSFFSCKKKVSDDNAYFQPYKKDTAVVQKIDSIPVERKDTVVSQEFDLNDIRPVDLNDKFFIVVASFSVEDYAIAEKQKLAEMGLQPQIFMLNDDGWNKLAIGSYNSFDQATEVMNHVKQRGGIFAGARIVAK